MSIYSEVLDIQKKLEQEYDLETGEVYDQDELNSLRGDILATGLESLCKVRVNMQNENTALKSEENRLKEKRQSIEKQLARLENYILVVHGLSGESKSVAGTFTVGTRLSTQVIVDDDFNNEDYQEIVETKKIDKMKIKKDLQEGILIDGARLQENKNLSVK